MSNEPYFGELIEYRIKPVTRYIVTRFERTEGGSASVGCPVSSVQFDNPDIAYEVAYALAKADHERKGWKPDDRRIQYPLHPNHENAQPAP